MESSDNDQLYVIESSCIWIELNDLFFPISLFSKIPIRVYVTFIRKSEKKQTKHHFHGIPLSTALFLLKVAFTYLHQNHFK